MQPSIKGKSTAVLEAFPQSQAATRQIKTIMSRQSTNKETIHHLSYTQKIGNVYKLEMPQELLVWGLYSSMHIFTKHIVTRNNKGKQQN